MTTPRPLRILFVCTRNSARSQLAEAMLGRKGRERYTGGSAGAEPAASVHPMALKVLANHGITWAGVPKGLEAVLNEPWDFVITLCDRAREQCPSFRGGPSYAHWSMPDPAEVTGDEDRQYRAFDDALSYVSARIDLMIAVPHAQMAAAAESYARTLSDVAPAPTDQSPPADG